MNNNNSSNSSIENEEFIKFVGLNPNQIQFIEDMDSNKLLSYINKFNNEIKNGNIESNYIDFLYFNDEQKSNRFDKGYEFIISFSFCLVKNGICNNFKLETDADEYGGLDSFTNKNDFEGICNELDDWVSYLKEIENCGFYKKGYENVDSVTGAIWDVSGKLKEKFKNTYFRSNIYYYH